VAILAPRRTLLDLLYPNQVAPPTKTLRIGKQDHEPGRELNPAITCGESELDHQDYSTTEAPRALTWCTSRHICELA
jgi:hypothetical protein